MSIDLDPEGKVQLRQLIGVRLRAARKAAKMTEMDAARVVGHETQAQVSLWESGARMPTIHTIIKLADAYSVPVDFIFGRIDDPIADPLETNQGVIVGIISNAIRSNFDTLVTGIAQDAAVTMEGYSTDRRELREMCELSASALKLLARVIEINPEFEEDWRGSAPLKATLERMAEKGVQFSQRIERERLKLECVDREIKYAELNSSVAQFSMTFSE